MQPKTELTGRVIFVSEPGYHSARMDFNRRFSKYPLVIVFCQEVPDVINAIRWARENGIRIRIRAGRHSFEAFSLTDGGIIIDVSELTDIRIDRQHIAKIGAGIQLLPLYQKLAGEGLTIPGGTCPTVGLAGLTLGGGFGMLTRLLGMLCDNLVAVEMVTADGEIITADSCRHHPNLFWASCGGGGGNFGVVTAFTFQAFPISEVAIFNIVWDWTESAAVIKAWQEWAPATDERLTSIIRLFTPGTKRIISTGEFVGPQAELRDLLEPLITTGHPATVDILSVPYLEAVRTFAGIGPIAGKFGITESKPIKFKHTGAYVLENLPDQAIQRMLDFMRIAPNETNSVEFQALAGAVNRVAPEATAYFHRAARFNLHYKANWISNIKEEPNIIWVEDFRSSMRQWTVGDYVNFPDTLIANWPKAYYGDNWERLKQVKHEYDPKNIFHFPQSIPPG